MHGDTIDRVLLDPPGVHKDSTSSDLLIASSSALKKTLSSTTSSTLTLLALLFSSIVTLSATPSLHSSEFSAHLRSLRLADFGFCELLLSGLVCELRKRLDCRSVLGLPCLTVPQFINGVFCLSPAICLVCDLVTRWPCGSDCSRPMWAAARSQSQ